jgi:hypothetical protein
MRIRNLIEHGCNNEEAADYLMASPAGARYGGDRAKVVAEFKRIRLKGAGDVRRAPQADAPWPEPLGEAAYHGLAGDIVRAIEPESEADPASLLVHFLAAFGNVAGRAIYYRVEETRHHGNVFAVIVGDSSKGRKGTAWGRVRAVLHSTTVVLTWLADRTMGGLSSGEGLIEQVRDPVIKTKRDGETGEVTEEIVDEGIADKRLLIVETEFSRTLRAMLRTENVLSAIIRCAWDGDDLRVLTRKSPARATAPHISIVAHTTTQDLRRFSPRTAAAILQRVGGKLAEDDRAELERLLAAATDEKLATGLARASQAMREPISHERRIAQDEVFAARYPGAARIEVDNTGQQPPRRRASAGRASSFVEEIERRVKVMR